MQRLCSSWLLSLLIASAAGATPLALSATDVTWTTSEGGVRSTFTLHLADMAYPAPGIGLIQLSITGHVVQPDYRHHYLEVVGMEIYGDHGGSAVRAALLSTEFNDPSIGATATTFSPGISGYADPITYAWIDYGTGVPARQLDWTSTATLLVYGIGDQPKSVDFWSHYVAVSCPSPRRCERGLTTAGNLDVQVMAAPEPSASNVGFRLAMIPEPGTGLLVIAGLLGLAGWRRARA